MKRANIVALSMSHHQRHARISTALAFAIVVAGVAVVGAIAYALLTPAVPAHGMTTTQLQPRAWLMVQRDYAAPVQSSCAAPGPCEQEMSR